MTVPAVAGAAHFLRRAAVRATLAASVQHTQPWRFLISENVLEVHSDPGRRLQVLDPSGRQMLISCGCALLNARAALAADGCPVAVERFPDFSRPQVLARVALGSRGRDGVDGDGVDGGGGVQQALAQLDQYSEQRRTNRWPFTPESVPPDGVAALVAAAEAEGAALTPVTTGQDRATLLALSAEAAAAEAAEPAYSQGLHAWTDGNSDRQDQVPAGNADSACLLLLGTHGDDPGEWLRAGEALERVLLVAAGLGYAVSPFTHLIEVGRTRLLLRRRLGLAPYPQVLLRVGRAPATPAPRLRRLADMVWEEA